MARKKRRREIMLILVNASSSSGRAAERWEAVEKELANQKFKYTAVATQSEAHATQVVRDAIKKGEKFFVAAGGDGTVNGVLNAIMDPSRDRPRASVIFGAIGLGSSNDYHKPMDQSPRIADVPAHIDDKNARLVDVGKAVMVDTAGKKIVRYFILNASIGFVAEGNAYFNTNKPVLAWFKRRNTDLAILYTIIVMLCTYKNIKASISLDGGIRKRYTITSLGILKKVQFSGDFVYDTPVTADDGMFDVNLWENMGRIGILGTLAALSKGKFTGRKKTRTWRAQSVEIAPDRPIHLELDGETTEIVSAELSVVHKAVKICW